MSRRGARAGFVVSLIVFPILFVACFWLVFLAGRDVHWWVAGLTGRERPPALEEGMDDWGFRNALLMKPAELDEIVAQWGMKRVAKQPIGPKGAPVAWDETIRETTSGNPRTFVLRLDAKRTRVLAVAYRPVTAMTIESFKELPRWYEAFGGYPEDREAGAKMVSRWSKEDAETPPNAVDIDVTWDARPPHRVEEVRWTRRP